MSTPVDIKALFTREIPQVNLYRVKFEIIDTVNIDFSVFMFDTETGRFSHVAMVYDLEMFPVGRELAAYNNIPYFRWHSGYVEYNELSQAVYFEALTKTRLKTLSNLWSRVTDVFTGSTVYDAASSTRG
jgi:hypothetical protein